ncbi:excisionase family DNA-binding protein [Chloroflexota bacterium]
MARHFEEWYPEYLTTGFVARRCGVSNMTVLRWITNGRLLAFKLPAGHYRINRNDFTEFLANHNITLANSESEKPDHRRAKQHE